MSDHLLCIDGGPRHSWKGTGMDIVANARGAGAGRVRCVYTARCDWCGRQAARAKPTDPPFKTGVRINP